MLFSRYPLASKQLIKSLIDSNAAVILTMNIRCEASFISSDSNSDIEARGDSAAGTSTGSSDTAAYTLSVTGAPVLDDPLASSRFADESLFTQCVRCLLACAHHHDRRHDTDSSSNGDSAADGAHDDNMTLDFDMMTVGHEHGGAPAIEQSHATVAAAMQPSQLSCSETGASECAIERNVELTEFSATSSTRVVDACATSGAVCNGSESSAGSILSVAERNGGIPLVMTAQSEAPLPSSPSTSTAPAASLSSTSESSEHDNDDSAAATFITAAYEYRPLLALPWLQSRSYRVAFYASAAALVAIFFVPDLDPGNSTVAFALRCVSDESMISTIVAAIGTEIYIPHITSIFGSNSSIFLLFHKHIRNELHPIAFIVYALHSLPV